MVWTHPRDKKRPPKPPLFVDKHWEECYQSYLRGLRTKNPVATTSEKYSVFLRRFFASGQDGDLYTRQDVERFLQAPHARTGQPTSPNTYNAKLNALAGFYTYASGYELMYRGKPRLLMTRRPPTTGIDFARHSSRSRALTDDELDRIFAVIDTHRRDPILRKRDRALFLIYLWSGRRRREITDLRWGYFEEVPFYDTVPVRYGWIYRWRGKGHVEVDDATEMPKEAMEALIEYLEADGRWGRLSPQDPVFPGRWGECLTPNYVNETFWRYCHLAGVDAAGIHRFRHTAARARYEITQDVESVRVFLRHDNIASTMIYIQESKHQADKVAPRLSKRFGHL